MLRIYVANIEKFPGPCANLTDSASSRPDQLAQSYLVRDQNWFWPQLLSTARSLNDFRGLLNLKTLQPMKMKVKKQSQKRLSLLVLFSKNEKL